jgi:hypothetical protein
MNGQFFIIKLLIAILNRLMFPKDSFINEDNRSDQLLCHNAERYLVSAEEQGKSGKITHVPGANGTE